MIYRLTLLHQTLNIRFALLRKVQKFLSYCSWFRFHKIFISNPMFARPTRDILFTETHLSRSGVRLGESKLKMFNAENI